MIFSFIQGGLGNQLFQYAAAISLAQKTKTQLILDAAWFNLHKGEKRVFKLPELFPETKCINKHERVFFSPENQSLIDKIKQSLFYGKPVYYKEPGLGFDENFFNLTNSVYLDGNFQSFRYHEYLPKAFHEAFFNYKGGTEFNQAMVYLQANRLTAVHVRRGDYVHDKTTSQVHGALETAYYHKAMELMKQNKPGTDFIFFSDDVAFVKETFGNNAKTIAEMGIKNDLEEMILMASCQHTIIANSSFSWWGARLNLNKEQLVIAPEKWFNNPPAGFNTRSLLLPSWIKI